MFVKYDPHFCRRASRADLPLNTDGYFPVLDSESADNSESGTDSELCAEPGIRNNPDSEFYATWDIPEIIFLCLDCFFASRHKKTNYVI